VKVPWIEKGFANDDHSLSPNVRNHILAATHVPSLDGTWKSNVERQHVLLKVCRFVDVTEKEGARSPP
jgi:hypothetical protein